jgi:hypothetical protein
MPMRKIFRFMLGSPLAAIWLIACGSSIKSELRPPPKIQITAFAYMQQSPTTPFTPMLGKFEITSGNTTFSSTVLIDATTNNPFGAEFHSIILSANGKKAALDLLGGLNAGSDTTQIIVMNVDGSGAVQITNDNNWNELPQFSPDGNKVIFNSYRLAPDNSWHEQLVVRNADSTGAETVLPLPAGTMGFWAPTFSPSGSKIAVEAWGQDPTNPLNGYDGIWVMDADGSNVTMLTNPQAPQPCDANSCFSRDEYPSFSVDGSKIMFSRETHLSWSDQSSDSEDIFIMNADGSGVAQLTINCASTASCMAGAISFDPLALKIEGVGERILFSSNAANPSNPSMGGGFDGSVFEIYAMKLDGTGVTRLTDNSAYDSFSILLCKSGRCASPAKRVKYPCSISAETTDEIRPLHLKPL